MGTSAKLNIGGEGVAAAPVGGDGELLLVSGPCVIESPESCIDLAGALAGIARGLGLPFIFKASFDKANRTSVKSFRGPGLDEGLAVLAEVRKRHGVPVLTDIHTPDQAAPAGEVADVLQIPAFLCRQTDLLVAAGRTGKPVNVKKGQFLAPDLMRCAVEKVRSGGGRDVLLTERGTTFGHGDLVVDMRSVTVMKETGCPVLLDATHSVQRPGGRGDRSGGERRFVPTLVRAAVAAGADGIYVETHPDPAKALSDADTQLPLSELAPLLEKAKALRRALSGA